MPLKSNGHAYVNRLLGLALAVFALLFIRDGLHVLVSLESARDHLAVSPEDMEVVSRTPMATLGSHED